MVVKVITFPASWTCSRSLWYLGVAKDLPPELLSGQDPRKLTKSVVTLGQ